VAWTLFQHRASWQTLLKQRPANFKKKGCEKPSFLSMSHY